MRTILSALCATAAICVAVPASSQDINLMGPNTMKLRTQEDVDAEAKRNRDYQNTIKKMPDQNVKPDPWGNMRGGGTADSDLKKKQRAGAQ